MCFDDNIGHKGDPCGIPRRNFNKKNQAVVFGIGYYLVVTLQENLRNNIYYHNVVLRIRYSGRCDSFNKTIFRTFSGFS